jgi:steroid 5-alpha reductase family enzyme
VISLPLLAAQINGDPNHFTSFDVLGVLVWAAGFFFEVVGDWQLSRFKGNQVNEGKVMRSGRWAYTRHPNYFGDAVLWWGYFLIAAGTPDGYLTVFSPIFMTFVLTRLSGIGVMDPHLKATRPGYQEYISGTSAFFPWVPVRHT